MLWIWLHLLQCNVSNQYKTCDEDKINKPWRPLPANRVTFGQAQFLRWALVVVCALFSLSFGTDVAVVSLVLTLTMIVYDEVGLAGHWAGKNICAVYGYGTFEIGATKIMGETSDLDAKAQLSVVLSAMIVLTTIHVQDFPDIEGDAALGRRTIPIVFPGASRIVTPLLMLGWTAVVVNAWKLGLVPSTLMYTLGLVVAARIWADRSTSGDKTTYLTYNIWLICAHLLPANARFGVLSW
ncbi:hypothetical protein DACRYDRAFT_23390 [Dacryopinax primogenitus]|uniref:UbiA prenyltransferase n=1 Tax=Dacryopinax primogenitus (strain DJM 731) TaxID=1858805 RepID=M5G7R0_DACPD|nr:uncharacterized protein DACRYDRAFT_23390 [Dacryopinax primogenitus]EJT99812.1 hypothetical protein DACRYDRAFT_23390 [Dacryopinax primogenitus]